MPNRPKNGWSSLHCTMDDLIYDLSLINPKYASESFILNRANINLEVTAEEASESFEQYPLLKHLNFYEWRDTKEKAKDAIQYINQIDQLNKVS
jgi:phage-related tail protein